MSLHVLSSVSDVSVPILSLVKAKPPDTSTPVHFPGHFASSTVFPRTPFGDKRCSLMAANSAR